MKSLLTIIIVFGILYLAFLGSAYFFANNLIFFPPRAGYTANTPHFFTLKTRDQATIWAVYLPNKNAKYTILISHGNAEDIGYMLPFLHAWQAQGFAVFAYDYHGYGLSTGRPNEQNCYADINAGYAYLTQNLHVPASHIIAYGRSLGSAVALDLAVRKPIAGLIMESPFLTAFRVLTQIPLLPFDEFNNLEKIKLLTCPLLIIHGKQDRIVPFWQGQKLYLMAKTPKQFFAVKNAGHNNVAFKAGNDYWRVIAEFVNKKIAHEPMEQ